ncbi:MAG: BatA and WFA domain-containing protein [Planctomycetaceae bacterium]|jgi:hypothetical protein|nr:BatA and WFA domain-containing protein [Planctomycetaceae bacterium]
MNLLNPFAFWLLLLAVPVIVLYLLRVEFHQVAVSTTMLWNKVFAEQHLYSRYRKLRTPISLLLTLLLLATLVAALCEPVFTPQSPQIRYRVIVVDNSATMNAIESNGLSRLEIVLTQLQKLFAGSSETNNVSTAILTTSDTQKIQCGFTTQQSVLRRAANKITATDPQSALSETLSLATNIIEDWRQSEIVVHTDACVNGIEQFTKNERIKFIVVGQPSDNVAITTFQPRLAMNDTSVYEVLVEVANFGTAEAKCKLEVYLSENPIDVVTLNIKPFQRVQRIVTGIKEDEEEKTLQAKLTNIEDALKSDNTARAAIPATPKQKINVYGTENNFLKQALLAQPNADVNFENELPTVFPSNTIIVFHQTVPETIPNGNVLIIDARNNNNLFDIGEPIESPLAGIETEKTTLTNSVTTTNLTFKGARKINIKQTNIKVEASTPEDTPLYFSQKTPTQKTVVINAALEQNGIIQKAAFPIIIANTLTFFRNKVEQSETKQKNENNLYATNKSIKENNQETKPIKTSEPIYFWLTIVAIGIWTTQIVCRRIM